MSTPNAPPDPSVFRAHHNSDCQCACAVECSRSRHDEGAFVLLTGDSDGKVKLWNGETLRNAWTLGDDEDDARVSILGIEVVEDNEEVGRYAFVTHGRDGSARLWVSSSYDKNAREEGDDEYELEAEENEGDFFLPKRWRWKPMLKHILETESECHTFCRMSNVVVRTEHSEENEKKVTAVFARPASERGMVELVSVDLEAGRMTSKPIPLERKLGGEENGEREKYGSVSALKFLSKRTLMVGYESGHVTVARTNEGDVDAFSSDLQNNTQRCFKDMVTCIDSHLLEEGEKDGDNETNRLYAVAIGCADGSASIYRVSESVHENVFELQKGSTKGPYHSQDDSTQGVASLSFRSDHKLLAVGYWDGKTRIFAHSSKSKKASSSLLACLKPEKLVRTDRFPGVTSVKFRERGQRELLVCTRGDGCCRMWPIFPS